MYLFYYVCLYLCCGKRSNILKRSEMLSAYALIFLYTIIEVIYVLVRFVYIGGILLFIIMH